MPLNLPAEPVDISGLLTKAWFDQIIGNPAATPPDLGNTVTGILNKSAVVAEILADVTMDGSEKALVHFSEATLLEYQLPFVVEGYVDLTPMQAGDTIVVREYASLIESPLTYRLYATHTYSGAQTEPLVHFTKKFGAYAYRTTAQQTAGVNRTLRIYGCARRVK